jgi:hypothetical protein
MYLTEKQAKNKFCPKSLNTVSTIDGNTTQDYGHCWASKCMAWRFKDAPSYDGSGGECRTVEDHGYCGLVGKPEGDS